MALTVLVVVAAALVAASGAAAASPNRLNAASVSPTAGTTDTVFTFSVRYRSQAGSPAVSVTAFVAGLTVPLELVQGTAVNGVYAGTSTLPIGTWTVTFEAIAEAGNNPTASTGPVTVTAPATPTPVPTPPPPPPPTSIPPPVAPPPAGPTPPAPGVATPAVTPSSSPLAGVAAGGPSEPSAPANLQGRESGILPEADGASWAVLLGGLALVAMVAGVGAYWVLGERRRQESDPPLAEVSAGWASPQYQGPAPLPGRSARRAPAAWELDSALDDEPIGTVDLLPDDSAADNSESEMHGWGDGTERRSPRRRA